MKKLTILSSAALLLTSAQIATADTMKSIKPCRLADGCTLTIPMANKTTDTSLANTVKVSIEPCTIDGSSKAGAVFKSTSDFEVMTLNGTTLKKDECYPLDKFTGDGFILKNQDATLKCMDKGDNVFECTS